MAQWTNLQTTGLLRTIFSLYKVIPIHLWTVFGDSIVLLLFFGARFFGKP